MLRDDDFPNRLSNLNELRGASLRMRLQLPPLCALIRLIVVIDVAEQETVIGLVDNEPNIVGESIRYPEFHIRRQANGETATFGRRFRSNRRLRLRKHLPLRSIVGVLTYH